MKSPTLQLALSATLLLVGCSNEDTTAPDAAISAEQSKTPASPVPQPGLAPAPEDDSPGLAVGERAPEFDSLDQHGQSQSLSEMLGSGKVALVFYRSADW